MMRLETLLWAMEWVESGLLEVLEDPNEIGSKAWLDSSAVDGKHSDNFFRMSDIKVLECNVMITHPRKTYCFRASLG